MFDRPHKPLLPKFSSTFVALPSISSPLGASVAGSWSKRATPLAADSTNPLLLMNVAVLARLNVKRLSSPLMAVKSSESVEPSPPSNIPGLRMRRGRSMGRVRMGQIVYQSAPIVWVLLFFT